MLLATNRPAEVHLGEISPFNVASEYELPDLTPAEVEEFIIRASKHLTARNFTDEAAHYLFSLTHGHMALTQEICIKTLHSTEAETITRDDIAIGAITCFESNCKSVTHMLEVQSLPKQSHDALRKLASNQCLLPFRRPGIAELVVRGLIRRSIVTNRHEFRSPLVRYLFLATHGEINHIPTDLTDTEQLLLGFPQLIALLLDEHLERDARFKITPFAHNRFERFRDDEPAEDRLPILFRETIIECQRFLENRAPEIDNTLLRAFYLRYEPLEDLAPPNRDDIYRVIAKIYTTWLFIELGFVETKP
jgi:hypothetical protein